MRRMLLSTALVIALAWAGAMPAHASTVVTGTLTFSENIEQTPEMFAYELQGCPKNQTSGTTVALIDVSSFKNKRVKLESLGADQSVGLSGGPALLSGGFFSTCTFNPLQTGGSPSARDGRPWTGIASGKFLALWGDGAHINQHYRLTLGY